MPQVKTLLRWRVLILAWLITWVTTVPLYHIHVPDITDRWSALQSGGAHTVFTPDLPGEFSHPFRDNAGEHASHLSPRGVNSPELGIAVFAEPDDRKVKGLHISLGVPFHFPDTLLRQSTACAFPGKLRQLQPLLAVFSPRAPPRLVSV